jgi:formylglycine-generating enzyme required for sulfatase activity
VKNQLPVTNVSPEQAQAFCAWIGGRLPTEIEWESAVRGLADRGYPFPWGSGEPTGERCRIFDADPEHELGPVPVETLTAGASPLGLMNAIGNAAEWCVDSHTEGTGPGGFILRGCSFATANIHDVRLTWRGPGDPRGEEMTGFRVLIPALESARDVRPATREPNPARVEARPASPYWVLQFVPWETLARSIRPLR